MFNKEVYVRRRQTLLDKMRNQGATGVVLFIGNIDAPAQYRDNCYKFRQESCWLYYFGIDEARYAALLDLESGSETIYADDVDRVGNSDGSEHPFGQEKEAHLDDEASGAGQIVFPVISEEGLALLLVYPSPPDIVVRAQEIGGDCALE